MKITKHGNIYELSSVQKLPISLEKAWDFLSSPANLKEITPDYMGFDGNQTFDTYPVERYTELLRYIKQRYEGTYWLALAREVAGFWSERCRNPEEDTTSLPQSATESVPSLSQKAY